MPSPLPATWEVPEIFRARLGERAGKQRIMQSDGHLLIILHKVPEPGNPERDSILFWRNAKGEWRSTERGSGLAALNDLFEVWAKTVDDQEERMQQQPSAENFFSVVQATTPLLRSIRNTYRALQEAREAFPEERSILIARDKAGDLERTIELLHTDAQHGMEFMIAKQSEEQARQAHQLVVTGHRLNLLVALFLPLTAIGSMFGMNMVHGLEEWNAPWMFWTLLVVSILGGLLLLAVIASRPKVQPSPGTGHSKPGLVKTSTRQGN
ncbi:MAG: CorA family divalent cation transporter [Limisphaerales bacterium]